MVVQHDNCNNETCEPRHEVEVERSVEDVVASKDDVEDFVDTGSIRPLHADVFWPLVGLVFEENLFGFQLVFRNLRSGIVASGCLPGKDMGILILGDDFSDLVRRANSVEIVVKVGHD